MHYESVYSSFERVFSLSVADWLRWHCNLYAEFQRRQEWIQLVYYENYNDAVAGFYFNRVRVLCIHKL